MNLDAYTNLISILTAIQNQLLTTNTFQPNSCFIGLDPDINPFPGNDITCIITPGRQVVEQPLITGGGDQTYSVLAKIGITIWQRLMLDRIAQDQLYMTDTSFGLLTTLNAMVSSLQNPLFFPLTADGDYLLQEPMKLLEIEPAHKRGLPGWGSISTTWQAYYLYGL